MGCTPLRQNRRHFRPRGRCNTRARALKKQGRRYINASRSPQSVGGGQLFCLKYARQKHLLWKWCEISTVCISRNIFPQNLATDSLCISKNTMVANARLGFWPERIMKRSKLIREKSRLTDCCCFFLTVFLFFTYQLQTGQSWQPGKRLQSTSSWQVCGNWSKSKVSNQCQDSGPENEGSWQKKTVVVVVIVAKRSKS